MGTEPGGLRGQRRPAVLGPRQPVPGRWRQPCRAIGTSNVTLTLAALCFRSAERDAAQLHAEPLGRRDTRQTPDGEPHDRHRGSRTREQLHDYLHAAMQLEHATIPPYLTALYSIRPGTNADAVPRPPRRRGRGDAAPHAGGQPPERRRRDARPDQARISCPTYPAYLPDGETDFEVEPAPLLPRGARDLPEHRTAPAAPDASVRLDPPRRTRSGNRPRGQPGATARCSSTASASSTRRSGAGCATCTPSWAPTLFCGDPARQVTPEYFYSGGGEIIPVTDMESAHRGDRADRRAGRGIRRPDLRRRARARPLLPVRAARPRPLLPGRGPAADNPPGRSCDVDWDAVYPDQDRRRGWPTTRDDSRAVRGGRGVQPEYADFLDLLTQAYNGRPALLLDAVVDMFRLRDQMTQLIHNPIPGQPGLHAAPTFEMAPARRRR